MPLYSYQCTACGHVVELIEKASAKKQHTCEKCGSRRMEKLMTTFSVGANSSGSSCPTGTCPLS